MAMNPEEIRMMCQVLTERCKNIKLDDIPFFKNGGHLVNRYEDGHKIRIKKSNRGKFTASAKQAGESVQQHAHSVMNNPNATPLQKKRANFAIQAKKWHHN